MKKAYILTFDKGGLLESFDYSKFHNHLTSDPNLVSWWHYLENSYILITDSRIKASYFSDLFKQIGNNKFVFVCELNIDSCNGWLPPDAWEWIKKFQSPYNPWSNSIIY